ncbi:MAG: Crp/Fnr family transcriptional regulator [Clostridia bacterium]|jgi:CRP/FNR family transcriptional regulator
MVTIDNLFPVYGQLDEKEKQMLNDSILDREVKKGSVLHRGSMDCDGLYVVRSGQLRAYMVSDEGKEVTLYRLFERDICLLSASCMLSSIQFEITVEAEKDTSIWVIPVDAYQKLMNSNAAVTNYTNQLMATRFSDVMWLLDKILFRGIDSRLASFILEESNIEGTDTIRMTHEKMANHLGTAREVVTRMLKYFQDERIVSLTRGGLTITDRKKLTGLAK